MARQKQGRRPQSDAARLLAVLADAIQGRGPEDVIATRAMARLVYKGPTGKVIDIDQTYFLVTQYWAGYVLTSMIPSVATSVGVQFGIFDTTRLRQ